MGLYATVACAESRPSRRTSGDAWNAPDSTAQSILGNRLSSLLSNPKKVNMYNVVYCDSLHRDNALVETDFVLDTLICKLNKEQIATLDFLLVADAGNYAIDTLAIPLIPHRPMFAFDFKGKNENAIVWYSPDDYTWGIRYDGRDILYYNVAHPELMSRLCNKLSHK